MGYHQHTEENGEVLKKGSFETGLLGELIRVITKQLFLYAVYTMKLYS